MQLLTFLMLCGTPVVVGRGGGGGGGGGGGTKLCRLVAENI